MLGKEESLGKYKNIYSTSRTGLCLIRLHFYSDKQHCYQLNLFAGLPKRRLLVETTLRQ